MKRSALAILSILIGSSLAVPGADALPVLPPDAGNIAPSIDWEKSLSPTTSASGFDCTFTSVTGTTAVSVGQTFAPTTNQMTDGLTLLRLINTPTADTAADCTSSVTLPSGPINVSGAFDAPGLASVEGVGSAGTISLSCTATSPTSPFTVTVTARFGGAVPGKARITGKSGPSDITFDCTLSLRFTAGATLSGTVAGLLTVADQAVNPSCTGYQGPTCIPIGVSSATVTVASGTGALADAAGTGTYSFNDLIKLAAIDESLSKVGVSSVRSASVRTSALGANADELRLSLTKGAPTVRVFRPAVSGKVTFGRSGSFQVVSIPGAKCSMSATYRKKTVTLGSSTLAETGTGTLKIASSAAKKLKAAGIKKKTGVVFRINCAKGTSKAAFSSKGVYSG